MRSPRRSLIALLLATSLTGCMVGPDYNRPTLATPAGFMGAEALAQRRAASSSELISWWNGFNDPVLTELVSVSLKQNLDIEQAVARVTQSRASLRAANAALLPSGGVRASATEVHLSKESPLGSLLAATPGYNREGELYEANADLSWEIDLFGGRQRDREAARAEYQASTAGVAAARLSVAAQTADTYVVIRGLQERLQIARSQVDAQRRLLALVQLQYDKGIAAELQLRQSEGALAQVQATVPVLDAALESALNALDVLLAAQPGTYRAKLLAPAPVPLAPSITEVGGPADLLRRRPDLIIAERRLVASNARIGSAISEYYPKFSLSGLLGTATTSAGNVFSGGANQAQGVFGLRWRLFDFGRVDAEIASARGANAEALAAYRLAVLRASEDVEDSFAALVRREDQERTLAAGVKSLARAKFSSEAAYKGGVVSLIEVLDADNRLLATRDARAQAATEAARAAISSFRALGGGWDSNIASAASPSGGATNVASR